MVFQQIWYFVTVAECGSVNQAAEQLFISQQSLRASINSLEQKLGFPLFSRSSKGMQLTETGAAILADAKQILSISAGWDRYLTPESAKPATVQIIASPLIYTTVLTDLVMECHAKYPELRLMIYNARDHELLEKLTDHTIGVLASAPADEVRHQLRPFAIQHHKAIETCAPDQFCVYLNCAHPLAQNSALTTKQLRSLILLSYPGEEERFYYRSVYRHFSSVTPYRIEKQESIFQMISEMPDTAAVFPQLAIVGNTYVEQGRITALPVRDFPMPAISCMLLPLPDMATDTEKIVAAMIRQRLLLVSQQKDLLLQRTSGASGAGLPNL